MPDTDDNSGAEETTPRSPLHAYKEGRKQDVEGDAEKFGSGDPDEVLQEGGSAAADADGGVGNPVGGPAAAGRSDDPHRTGDTGSEREDDDFVDPDSPARAQASRPPRGYPARHSSGLAESREPGASVSVRRAGVPVLLARLVAERALGGGQALALHRGALGLGAIISSSRFRAHATRRRASRACAARPQRRTDGRADHRLPRHPAAHGR